MSFADATQEPEQPKVQPTRTASVVLAQVQTAVPEIIESKPRAEPLIALAPEARIELSSSLDEDVEPSSLADIHNLFNVKSTVGLEGNAQNLKMFHSNYFNILLCKDARKIF